MAVISVSVLLRTSNSELERQAYALDILKRCGDTARRVLLPIKTISEANRASHEHWRKRQQRAKAQSSCSAIRLRSSAGGDIVGAVRSAIGAGRRVVVLMIRIAPSSGLDYGDNLASSMKHVRDGIAREIGIDDRSTAITWVCEQRRGPYGVEVVFAVDGGEWT